MLCGVGLVLVNEEGKILVVRELKDKPVLNKKAGMLTFPLETVKPPETPEEAVRRLVKEELGDAISITNLGFLGAFHILDSAITLGYVAECGNAVQDFKPRDDDIEIVGWMRPELLAQKFIRDEVEPILLTFLKR